MFPRHRGGFGAGRGLVIAALPLLMGAAVLLAGGDRSSPTTTRLEANQAAVAPFAFESQPPTTETGAPIVAADPPAVPATTGTVPEVVAVPQPGPVPAAATTAAVTREAPSTTAPPRTTTTQVDATTSSTSTTTSTTVAPRPARLRAAEAEVTPLTNTDRSGEGLGALTRDACLDSVASGYAEQMARSGVLAHNPGAGPAVIGCRAGATWGDNVGTAEPCDTALLEQKWMASPSHRRNILTGAFQLVGVGAWTDVAGGCWVQVLFSS